MDIDVTIFVPICDSEKTIADTMENAINKYWGSV